MDSRFIFLNQVQGSARVCFRGINFSALTLVQQTSPSSVWPLAEAAHVSDERGFVWQRTGGSDIVGLEWMDGRTEARQPPPPSASMSGRGGCDDDDDDVSEGRTERVNKLVFLFRDRMNLTCVRARFSASSLPLASCLVAPADWSASPWKVKKDRMLCRAVQHYWRWTSPFGQCQLI